ncbi:uncharacterized protein LOC110050800 [Orbicella faveolata]|uniref:uncharacterized protein LOC110050800 n=1 Tax=Orbicella faveolata TaxID=48498 RepID=UPI0009E3B87F|nr:uncharacterized protein LOC110050800 [Orbicella faveolata]
MVPYFTGRQKECKEITGHVTSGSTRIVSIWGSPGFGKTSVAIDVGHHLHSQGMPVYYLSLRGLQSKADLASKLLSLFRPPVARDEQNQLRLSSDDEVCYLLSGISDNFTIILDNADELLSEEADMKVNFLKDILRRTEKVTFVITTRESLESINVQFSGYQAVRIGPLDESSSLEMVQKLLPKATDSDCRRAAQICGHAPLAIRIMCGAFSGDDVEPSQSLSDFLNALESKNILDMLDNPDYLNDLRLKHLLESSFRRLPAQEKEALVSLSVLPASFDVTIAAAVLGISEMPLAKRVLLYLRRKSFLDSSTKHGSFSMHQLIRSFANQREEHEMKETILRSRTRLCAFYVSRFEKLNEKFLTSDSMSAFIDFYEDEQSITQSLKEGCSDSKTANSVFEVLVKAELFLYSVYWRDRSKFDKIYDSALEMARKLEENVFYRQLLVSKALYQVTWGKRGNTMQLLSEARNLEESCSPVSDDDKGKRLCYSGIYQLVNGQTETGIQSLEEAVSLMSGTPEKPILKNIAFEILATYHGYKNNSSGMSKFVSKSFQECQSPVITQLPLIPPMESTGKKTEEKGMTQQPLKLEIISLVSDAAKHLMDTETKRCIIDAVQDITNDIRKTPIQSSLGSFIFQCNANITLQCVMSKDEGADETPQGRIISCHETAVNLRKCPRTAPAKRKSTPNKEIRPRPFQATLRSRRPVKADSQQPSRLAENTQQKKSHLTCISTTQAKQQGHDSKLIKETGKEHSNIAGSNRLPWNAQHEQGDFSSALQSVQHALDIRLKVLGEDHSITADSYHSLGITQHKQGNFFLALQSKQRALDIRHKLFGEKHSSTADSYHSLGITQHALGDFSSALQSKQRALDIKLKLYGKQHSSTAVSYHSQSSRAHSCHSLALTQYKLGNFSSALQSAQRVLDIRLKLFGEEHSSTADSYYLLGITQLELEDFSSALHSAQHALDIRLKLFGKEHSSTADSYHLLGAIQYAQGDFTSALQSAQRALDIRGKLFGEEHSSTADSYHSLWDNQHNLGDFSSAL